jgi:hypothetical protein
MAYRTKTYIAADWDGDKNAVDKLYEWKKSKYWSLDFQDAHDLTQARDSSLNCNIKKSLKERLDASKTFVLIVGDKTNTVTSGSCSSAPCDSYNSWTKSCAKGYSVDYRSYIKYECDKAKEAYNEGKMTIVVLYNATTVDKSKCPDAVKNIGTHTAMRYRENGQVYWDYQAVKSALGQ